MAGGPTKTRGLMAYSSSKYSHINYYLDGGVSVSDGATVTGVKEWDVLRSSGDRANTAKLVLGLLLGDAVNDEPEKIGQIFDYKSM